MTAPLGIHSINHYTLAVPDLRVAQSFHAAFGLDAREERRGVNVRAFGDAAPRGRFIEGLRKRLANLSFGCWEGDLAALRARVERAGYALIDAPRDENAEGFWLRGVDDVVMQVRVAPKTTPDGKSEREWTPSVAGVANASYRRDAAPVRPRRLSHILLFTPDVSRAIGFYETVLGLKLSDRSGDIIAFMHGVHGSDHHLVALAKADAPGFHHASWDVASLDEIGAGAKAMADAGYRAGWGLGRHVIGSNYFHYVRDPWGSYAEYSCDIDYIPKGMDWRAGDHPPEDSIYLWGPDMPADFVVNHEA